MDHDLDKRANVSSVCYYWFAPPFGGGETEHAPTTWRRGAHALMFVLKK
jgi:hypothetical protein